MKTLAKLFLLSISFLLITCNSNKVVLKDLIDKINQAHGKAETINSLIDLKQKWNMRDSQGNTFQCVYLYKRPDKFRMTVSLPGQDMNISLVYNNRKGKINFFGQSRDMTEEEIQQYEINTLNFIDQFQKIIIKDDGSVKLLEDQEINGVIYHVMIVKDKYGKESKLFVTENGKVEIIETTQVNIMTKKPEPVKLLNKSYKNFNGVNLVSEIVSIDATGNETVMILEKNENNIGLTDDDFEIN